MATVLKSSFNRGEVSPGLYGRVDLDAYQGALAKAENAQVSIFGGIENRPGFLYVCPTGIRSLLPPRYLTFTRSAFDTVLLEFGHHYIQFVSRDRPVAWLDSKVPCVWDATESKWTAGTAATLARIRPVILADQLVVITSVDNQTLVNPAYAYISFDASDFITLTTVAGTTLAGQVITDPLPTDGVPYALTFEPAYRLWSPYTNVNNQECNDVRNLDYAQDEEVMTLVHPRHPVRELTRQESNNANWSLTDAPLAPKVKGPTGFRAVNTTPHLPVPEPVNLSSERDSLDAVTLEWTRVPGVLTYQTRYRSKTEHPVFPNATAPDIEWREGVEIDRYVVPKAAGPDDTEYAATGLPAGITFDPVLRAFTGTPTTAGTGHIVVTAGSGTTATGSVWTAGWEVKAATVAPAWTKATGPARSWVTGKPIAPFIVPPVDTGDEPTYAVDALPAGILFHPETRRVSGTPTGSTGGTGSIEATNSAGTATWSFTYTLVASGATPPFWTNAGGSAVAWPVGSPITPVVVPAVDFGLPDVTYAAAALPVGVTFDSDTRTLSGTPATPGAGTILITASNSEGSYDWRLPYAVTTTSTGASWGFAAFPRAEWTLGMSVAEVIPTADGSPAPSYEVTGLPPGLTFRPSTRTLSGTPTSLGSGEIIIRTVNVGGCDSVTLPYIIAEESAGNGSGNGNGNGNGNGGDPGGGEDPGDGSITWETGDLQWVVSAGETSRLQLPTIHGDSSLVFYEDITVKVSGLPPDHYTSQTEYALVGDVNASVRTRRVSSEVYELYMSFLYTPVSTYTTQGTLTIRAVLCRGDVSIPIDIPVFTNPVAPAWAPTNRIERRVNPGDSWSVVIPEPTNNYFPQDLTWAAAGTYLPPLGRIQIDAGLPDVVTFDPATRTLSGTDASGNGIYGITATTSLGDSGFFVVSIRTDNL